VGFVVDQMALGQVYLHEGKFSPVEYYSTNTPKSVCVTWDWNNSPILSHLNPPPPPQPRKIKKFMHIFKILVM
jgi:hypothetical protein